MIEFLKASGAALCILALAACGGEDAEVESAAKSGVEDMKGAAENAGMATIIKARQAGFKELGKAFKTISDNLRSGSPDIGAIQAAAASVPVATQGISAWFPKGSGPEAGIETDALPAIWEKPDDFAEKVNNFKTARANLVTAAEGGDIDAITQAFRATGGTCKGCHDSYRLDD